MFRDLQQTIKMKLRHWATVDSKLTALLSGDSEQLEEMRVRRKLAVFVSSTFTDTVEERNALVSEVFPKVREYAKTLGLEFEAVEMRWGIQDEAAADHRTWEFCQQQLERCRRESGGLYFLSLWAEKYGHTPLPPVLPIKKANQLRKHLPPEQQEVFDRVYRVDTNLSAKAFVLVPCTGENASLWNLHAPLQAELRVAATSAFDAKESQRLFSSSFTEAETELALHGLAKNGDRRVAWFRRSFSSGVPSGDKCAKKFTDLNSEGNVDETARSRWQAYCGPGGHFEETIDSLGSTAVRKDYVTDYVPGAGVTSSSSHLSQMCSDIEDLLYTELEAVADRVFSKVYNIERLGVSAVMMEEIYHHLRWQEEKAESFFGRELALGELMNAIMRPISLTSPATVAVVGPSGSGKTALLAAAAQRIKRTVPRSIVISRYLGTSGLSGTIHEALTSLSAQWHLLQGTQDPTPTDEPYRAFHRVIRSAAKYTNHVFVIFLDSLDQMAEIEESRSKLYWLEAYRWLRRANHSDPLPSNVRIVMSCLADGVDGYSYGCATRLAELGVPLIQLDTLSSVDVATAARGVLGTLGRKLSKKQMAEVLRMHQESSTPLLLRLNLRVAARWRSWDEPVGLVTSATEAIAKEFARLRNVYGGSGDQFVWRVLAYLNLSREGLSVHELEDILSLDDAVLHHLFVRWEPPLYRVPSGVLRMLLSELTGLLIERQGGLLQWYHRQLRETASGLVTDNEGDSSEVGSDIHAMRVLIAEYFRGDWSGCAKPVIAPVWAKKALRLASAPRFVPAQPLLENGPVSKRTDYNVNTRRCEEVAWQFLRAGELDKATDELCSAVYAECRFRAGQGEDYVQELLEALEAQDTQRLRDYARFARNVLYLMMRSPGQTLSEALNEPEHTAPFEDTLPLYFQSRPTLRGEASGMSVEDSGSRRKLPSLSNSDPGARTSLGKRLRGSFVASAFAEMEDSGPARQTSVTKENAASASNENDFGASLSVSSLLSGGSFMKGLSSAVTETLSSTSLSSTKAPKITLSDWQRARVWSHRFPCRLQRGPLSHTMRCEAAITCVVLSSDGKRLLVGTRGPSFGVYDVGRGEKIRNLEGHKAVVTAAAFRLGEAEAIAGAADGTIRVWDLEATGKTPAVHHAHVGEVTAIAVHPNGLFVVTASADQTVKVWTVATWERLQIVELFVSVQAFALSPRGDVVVAGDDSGKLWVWDLLDGACDEMLDEQAILSFRCKHDHHTEPVTCVAFDQDGSRLVSTAADGEISVREVHSGKVIWDHRHHARVSAVRFHSSANSLWVGCADKLMRVFNLSCGQSSAPSSAPVKTDPRACESRSTPAGGNGSQEKGLPAEAGPAADSETLPGSAMTDSQLSFSGHAEALVALDLNSSVAVAVSGSTDGCVLVWDLTAAAGADGVGHTDSATCVTLDKTGTLAVSGSLDKTLRVWDLDTLGLAATLSGHRGAVTAVMLNHDESQAIAGCSQGQIYFWKLGTGTCTTTLSGHTRAISAFALVSPNVLLSGSRDKFLRMWDLERMVCLKIMPGLTSVTCLSTYMKGERALVGYEDYRAIAWDLKKGEQLYTFYTADGIRSLTVTDDGSRALFGLRNGSIAMHNTHERTTKDALYTLKGHNGWVTGVYESQCGRFVFSSSLDQTIRVWDVVSGSCLRVLGGHAGGVLDVVPARSGSHFVSVSADNTVRHWYCISGISVQRERRASSGVFSSLFSGAFASSSTGNRPSSRAGSRCSITTGSMLQMSIIGDLQPSDDGPPSSLEVDEGELNTNNEPPAAGESSSLDLENVAVAVAETEATPSPDYDGDGTTTGDERGGAVNGGNGLNCVVAEVCAPATETDAVNIEGAATGPDAVDTVSPDPVVDTNG
eukprot:Rmarinus@m.10381